MTARQKSKEKAARIMAAAKAVLAREGYAGATIQKVSAEAQVSRGLLHYYFQNKEQMLARVLRSNMADIITALANLIQASQTGPEFCTGLTAALRELLTKDKDYPRLFREGLAVAKHSQMVRRELETLFTQYRQTLTKGLARYLGRDDALTQGRAGLIMAAMDGLAIQVLTMPRLAQKEATWQAFDQGIRLLMKGEEP